VASAEGPSDSDILSFLCGLRKYRARLSGPGQALLDSLVAAGLGRTPDQAPDNDVLPYWGAYAARSHGWSDPLTDLYGAHATSWETTPWGLACRARYG
jgi:hypothetical protein